MDNKLHHISAELVSAVGVDDNDNDVDVDVDVDVACEPTFLGCFLLCVVR